MEQENNKYQIKKYSGSKYENHVNQGPSTDVNKVSEFEAFMAGKKSSTAMNVTCLLLAIIIIGFFISSFFVPFFKWAEAEVIFLAGALLNALLTVRAYRQRQSVYPIFLIITIVLSVIFMILARGN